MQGPRSLRASAIAFLALAALAHGGCFLPAADPSAYYLAAPLDPVGAGGGAGRVEILFTAYQRTVFIAVEGLAPGAHYGVTIDGAPYATLATDSSGRASIHPGLGSPPQDPRGRRIAVVDAAGNEVLELASASDPRFFEAEVAPLSSFGLGAGQVQTTTIAGQRSFSALLQGAEPGSYDVFADGIAVATLDAPDGHGRAVVAPVPFDPGAAAIELQLDGVGYFAGSGHASIQGLDWCTQWRAVQSLESAGTGSAQVALSSRSNCLRRLEVVIEGVPMDHYELWIGDVLRASIAVGEDENGVTFGMATFAPGEGVSAPLDFDPVGASIEVRRAGETWFSLGAFTP
jgi:hypothetical protein